MAREIAISFYLFVFKMFFNIFNLYPQKEKTVAVASFGDNVFYATRAIRKRSDQEIIILREKTCRYKFDRSLGNVILFDMRHPINYLQSIYHLATATTILVETYHGFLAVSDFRPGTRCIQLWHAAGALKTFGLLDPTTPFRTVAAKDRFQKVYDRFDYTVVGSEKMVEVFKRSFGLTDNRIIRSGVPRTDFFYETSEKEKILRRLKREFPIIVDKKVILYAPTYRNEQLSNFRLEIDLKQLYHQLSDEYVLFIKLHPAVSYEIKEEYPNFVYDVSSKKINHLLTVTDILISDYSSIPFEYSFLEKPMLFFAYDLEEYQKESGLLEDYEIQMPGPVVYTTEEIIEVIKTNYYDMQKIRDFAIEWNRYSTGRSSMNLANFITNAEEKQKEVLV